MDSKVTLEQMQSLSKEDIDGIIHCYFVENAWTQMAEAEKELHRQEFVVFVTNPVTKAKAPKFLLDYQKRTQNQQHEDNKPGTSSFSEINDDKENQPSCSYQTRQTSNEANTFDFKVPDRFPPKKYPKRNSVATVNYFEEKEPPDDRYIFCDNCQEDVVDYCKKCGMLKCIKDVKVPLGMPERAILTAPKMVVIESSKIHGLGAFAATEILQGLRFGPYQGRLTKKQNESGKGYSWKLKRGKLVDAADEKFSNWMRYVNCARNSTEQNLVAFQYQGDLYYRTVRVIIKGEELLVFYGKDYCLKLGIDLKKFFNGEKEDNRQQEEKQNKDFNNVSTKKLLNLNDINVTAEESLGPFFVSPEEEKYFFCKFCKTCLTSQEFQKIHEKYCKFGKKKVEVTETFACNSCSLIFTIGKDRNIHQNRCKERKTQEKTHENVKNTKYTCGNCGKMYTSKDGLKYHIQRNHNKENVRMLKCTECDYETFSKTCLNSHLKMHSSFGILCIFCQKLFKRKSHLDNHYVTRHKDEMKTWKKIITCKVHTCSTCSYMTVQTSHLKRHLLIHKKGLAKFQYYCGICEFKSITKSNFKRHLNLHTGRLGLMCNLCDKKFNEKKQLDGHVLTQHSNNLQMMKSVTSKIHRCLSCPFTTVNIFHLELHIFSNHRENEQLMQTIASKIRKCNNCSYQTVYSQHMKQHNNKCQIKRKQ